MKKLMIVILSLCLLSVQAFAEEPEDDTVDSYPVGSYVDEAGNVYSPDGELLSPGTTPAAEPSVVFEDESPVVEAATSQTAAPVYRVVDLRPLPMSDFSLRSAGLKDIIVSIFGSYEPVTQETVVTETIDGSTVETVIRTVAPGLAGVDFEWIGSVLMFGVVLFCLGKLLGGMVK